MAPALLALATPGLWRAGLRENLRRWQVSGGTGMVAAGLREDLRGGASSASPRTSSRASAT
eukprot:2189777-Alexandrium_andersonii.AAC.1